MTDQKITIQYIPVDDLKPSEYNPRQSNEKQAQELRQSLETFGFVDPVIANSNPARKNVVIGGHFRLQVAKEMGFKVAPVVYIDIDDLRKEQELNLRLNKNTGSWDWDLLLNLDEDLLLEVGFDEVDLKKFETDAGIEGVGAEIEGEDEMYTIKLVFDDEIEYNKWGDIYKKCEGDAISKTSQFLSKINVNQ